MATRKHNEFLDTHDSEDDGSQGYNSEAEEVKKGGRSPKRRKVDSDASEDDEDPERLDQDDQEDQGDDSQDEIGAVDLNSKDRTKVLELDGVSKPLSKKNLVATADAIKRSGVVYLSRVPPFMKPMKLRSLLEPYGVINRIFLAPEDPASHTRRVRNGGNKKRLYTEGWIEWSNKKDAKHTCELLNAKTIGGKKGTYYRDDVWNLLYLKGFKWHNLTEQIASENAERSSRMRAEISKTTKENKLFVQNVETAKMLEGMESKKAVKKMKAGDNTREDGDKATTTTTTQEPKKNASRPRHFKQTEVASKKQGAQPDQVKRVLSKIF